jgi:hypothetical protein
MDAAAATDSLLRAGPARRLLVRGILAATSQMVRDAADPRKRDAMRRMMRERQRMLGELARDLHGERSTRCLDALVAAMAESDQTFGQLLDGVGVTTTSQ